MSQGDPTTLDGIIPADAGSTPSAEGCTRSYEDHPRGCGEHLSTGRHQAQAGGSSPRMRGAHGFRFYDKHLPGIIPADAGSTPSPRRKGRDGVDHPRGCGEH